MCGVGRRRMVQTLMKGVPGRAGLAAKKVQAVRFPLFLSFPFQFFLFRRILQPTHDEVFKQDGPQKPPHHKVVNVRLVRYLSSASPVFPDVCSLSKCGLLGVTNTSGRYACGFGVGFFSSPRTLGIAYLSNLGLLPRGAMTRQRTRPKLTIWGENRHKSGSGSTHRFCWEGQISRTRFGISRDKTSMI